MYGVRNPLIFSIGPLNGFLRFASKTAIVINDDGVIEDIYFSYIFKNGIFAGLDAIVIFGRSDQPVVLDICNTDIDFLGEHTDVHNIGLPGKRSNNHFENNKLLNMTTSLLQKYSLNKHSNTEKNIKGMVITGTEVKFIQTLKNMRSYTMKYCLKTADLRVDKGKYPSCSNCPKGCGKSKVGEIGGNVFNNSLVACQFADKIYTDIGIVFSCLNTFGYSYTHEDIENLPSSRRNN